MGKEDNANATSKKNGTNDTSINEINTFMMRGLKLISCLKIKKEIKNLNLYYQQSQLTEFDSFNLNPKIYLQINCIDGFIPVHRIILNDYINKDYLFCEKHWKTDIGVINMGNYKTTEISPVLSFLYGKVEIFSKCITNQLKNFLGLLNIKASIVEEIYRPLSSERMQLRIFRYPNILKNLSLTDLQAFILSFTGSASEVRVDLHIVALNNSGLSNNEESPMNLCTDNEISESESSLLFANNQNQDGNRSGQNEIINQNGFSSSWSNEKNNEEKQKDIVQIDLTDSDSTSKDLLDGEDSNKEIAQGNTIQSIINENNIMNFTENDLIRLGELAERYRYHEDLIIINPNQNSNPGGGVKAENQMPAYLLCENCRLFPISKSAIEMLKNYFNRVENIEKRMGQFENVQIKIKESLDSLMEFRKKNNEKIADVTIDEKDDILVKKDTESDAERVSSNNKNKDLIEKALNAISNSKAAVNKELEEKEKQIEQIEKDLQQHQDQYLQINQAESNAGQIRQENEQNIPKNTISSNNVPYNSNSTIHFSQHNDLNNPLPPPSTIPMSTISQLGAGQIDNFLQNLINQERSQSQNNNNNNNNNETIQNGQIDSIRQNPLQLALNSRPINQIEREGFVNGISQNETINNDQMPRNFPNIPNILNVNKTTTHNIITNTNRPNANANTNQNSERVEREGQLPTAIANATTVATALTGQIQNQNQEKNLPAGPLREEELLLYLASNEIREYNKKSDSIKSDLVKLRRKRHYETSKEYLNLMRDEIFYLNIIFIYEKIKEFIKYPGSRNKPEYFKLFSFLKTILDEQKLLKKVEHFETLPNFKNNNIYNTCKNDLNMLKDLKIKEKVDSFLSQGRSAYISGNIDQVKAIIIGHLLQVVNKRYLQHKGDNHYVLLPPPQYVTNANNNNINNHSINNNINNNIRQNSPTAASTATSSTTTTSSSTNLIQIVNPNLQQQQQQQPPPIQNARVLLSPPLPQQQIRFPNHKQKSACPPYRMSPGQVTYNQIQNQFNPPKPNLSSSSPQVQQNIVRNQFSGQQHINNLQQMPNRYLVNSEQQQQQQQQIRPRLNNINTVSGITQSNLNMIAASSSVSSQIQPECRQQITQQQQQQTFLQDTRNLRGRGRGQVLPASTSASNSRRNLPPPTLHNTNTNVDFQTASQDFIVRKNQSSQQIELQQQNPNLRSILKRATTLALQQQQQQEEYSRMHLEGSILESSEEGQRPERPKSAPLNAIMNSGVEQVPAVVRGVRFENFPNDNLERRGLPGATYERISPPPLTLEQSRMLGYFQENLREQEAPVNYSQNTQQSQKDPLSITSLQINGILTTNNNPLIVQRFEEESNKDNNAGTSSQTIQLNNDTLQVQNINAIFDPNFLSPEDDDDLSENELQIIEDDNINENEIENEPLSINSAVTDEKNEKTVIGKGNEANKTNNKGNDDDEKEKVETNGENKEDGEIDDDESDSSLDLDKISQEVEEMRRILDLKKKAEALQKRKSQKKDLPEDNVVAGSSKGITNNNAERVHSKQPGLSGSQKETSAAAKNFDKRKKKAPDLCDELPPKKRKKAANGREKPPVLINHLTRTEGGESEGGGIMQKKSNSTFLTKDNKSKGNNICNSKPIGNGSSSFSGQQTNLRKMNFYRERTENEVNNHDSAISLRNKSLPLATTKEKESHQSEILHSKNGIINGTENERNESLINEGPNSKNPSSSKYFICHNKYNEASLKKTFLRDKK